MYVNKMFPFSPQLFAPGNAPLGCPPNVQTQLFLQQPGLTQFDFPPLPSPYLTHQIPPQTPPSNHQTPNPLVTAPHLQHDTAYAPNNKYDSDVDFCTDTSDVENGKENPDEEKEHKKDHRHGWQHVKKRKRIHRSTESRTQINSDDNTQNRFTPLLNRQENEGSPQNSTHRDTPNIPRPPPIFVYGVKNFKAMLDDLADVAEPETYRTSALAIETVKISANTVDTYRILVKHMQEENTVHHTHHIKIERAYRIVILHLHHSVPLDDIKEELRKEGHTVRNIMNIKHKQTKDPLSLFFVDLEPQANNKEIFNLQFLGNIKITTEAPHKNRNIVQCQRCQAYGHSIISCTRPYQCVKCGGQNDSKVCTKPRHNPARCALCGEDHPANYKGCTVYRNLVATRSNQTRVNNFHHQHPAIYPTPQHPITIPPTSNKQPLPLNSFTTNTPVQNDQYTYAQITKHNQTPILDQSTIAEQLTTFLNDFKTMFSQLVSQNSVILNVPTTALSKSNP